MQLSISQSIYFLGKQTRFTQFFDLLKPFMMKKIYTLFIALFLFGNLSAQKAWTNIGEMDIPLGVWNENVFAFKDGITPYYTTSGRENAKAMGISLKVTEVLGAIHYLNKDELFTSTRKLPQGNTDCWISSDGGASFTKMGNMVPSGAGYIGQGADNMYFFDSKRGLAMVGVYADGDALDIMMRTSDGGATWALAHSDVEIFNEFEDVIYHRNGLVRVFADRDIYESDDHGTTWTKVADNPLSNWGVLVDNGEDNIWGVGWAGTQKPCYVTSTDGGKNFGSWTIPDENNGGIMGCGNSVSSARDIAFVAPSNILVAGFRASQQDRVTIISDDGGKTWQDATFPSGYSVDGSGISTSDDGTTFYYWDAVNKDLLVIKEGGGVGQPEYAANNFHMYPNPSNGAVTVSFPTSINGQWKLEVYNTVGRLVWQTQSQEKQYTIGKEHLPHTGTYLVAISQADGSYVKQQKLIILE